MNSTITIHLSHVSDSLVLAKNVLAVFAMITTVTGYLLANSYLNSVALAKECLLLYLYKEMVAVAVWIQAICGIEVVLGNYDALRQYVAFIVSFGFVMGARYLFIVMNITGFLKFYMMKKGLIDPPILWMGENEKSAIRRIRLICGSLVIGYLAISYGFGVYPHIYYSYLKDSTVQPDMGISTVVFRVPLIMFISIFVLTTIRTKLQEANAPKLDEIVPRTVYFTICFTLFLIATSSIVEYYNFFDSKVFFLCSQILFYIIHILFPPIAIILSNQLKSHSVRVLKNFFDEVFLLSIYIVPVFLAFSIYGTLFIM